ncbi:hypothetical protein [Streptomyces sp. B21-083]|uniref:hypothetical protein n=1 Tax=Streptomyces sp. B21-083 TaxID=3039410 RepID=UPI002FF279F4
MTGTLTAAALLAVLRALPAPAYAATCGAPENKAAFPLTTRIHGGPAAYDAGGGYGTWYLDLTNTTSRTCAGIHPVIVLVDARRALKPSQPRLEFYEEAVDAEGAGAVHPHAVRFEVTDAKETVGAVADGFPGFTVGPGKTLTVKLRLAVTSDAVPNEIVANAAVVQRHGDDGDWVGQSNDYRFRIKAGPAPDERPRPAPDETPDPAPDARAGFTDELARTGLGSPVAAAATAVVLVGVGVGGAVLVRRRRGRGATGSRFQ